MPLSLEEILRRFTTRRSTDPPIQPVEPIKPEPATSPVVINGMVQLLAYLADQDKRISALEDKIKEIQPTG